MINSKRLNKNVCCVYGTKIFYISDITDKLMWLEVLSLKTIDIKISQFKCIFFVPIVLEKNNKVLVFIYYLEK